jgi:ABC-type branched-subunit amino acid transport system substrate-binding protein
MDGPRVCIGLLHDFPLVDDGAAMEWAVRRGFDEVAASGRLPGAVEVVHRSAMGLPLPGGSAHSVQQAFASLVAEGVLAVIGPAITDNALVVAPFADAASLATIQYAGAEEGRSRCLFHFQIGSLEDEPSFLADHLARRGLTRVAMVQDSGHIGRRKAEFFEAACPVAGLALVARATVPPQGDTADAVRGLRPATPDALVVLGMWDHARAVSLALAEMGWEVPVVANSALIYGYHDTEWATGWDGWSYPDTIADDNARYTALRAAAEAGGRASGPTLAGAYDMGRLLAEGIARARHLTRDEVVMGLERVKALPAASGHPGTLMGFGHWERAALKGQYLVIRQWRSGRSVQWNSGADGSA